MTEMLTNILVEGTILANSSHTNVLTRIQKKKNVKNKKFRHPKWHDISFKKRTQRKELYFSLLENEK